MLAFYIHKAIIIDNWSSFWCRCFVLVWFFWVFFGCFFFFLWEDNESDERETYFLNKKISKF